MVALFCDSMLTVNGRNDPRTVVLKRKTVKVPYTVEPPLPGRSKENKNVFELARS